MRYFMRNTKVFLYILYMDTLQIQPLNIYFT